MNHGKVSMIGLDGATFALLKPLMDSGVMPFLRRFLQEGVHGDLLSTRNPLTPPAWISMITGRSPHVHGIYDFLRPATLEDGSVFLKVNDSRDIRSEVIWSIAQRSGRRATSLNFYGMSPPPPIDGYLISGFVPWKHLRHAMYPTGLFDTIKQMPDFDYKNLAMDIGEEKKCVQGLLEGEHEDWIKLQSDRDTAWAQICCRLMESDRTDLTALVLDGPDKIQHLFWRFVDPELQPAAPDPWFTRIRTLCLNYYRQLDANIERLVEASGPNSDIVMTSDHGFGATTEVVYINEWLARHGYLRWRESAHHGETGKLTADHMKDHLGMVDWRNSVAYCPTPSSNAIYVKRANGSSPGVKSAEYLEFCLRLRQQLLDFRDPANGKPVFVGVDANKLEGTPYVEPSPDITVRLRDGGFVSILRSAEIVVPRKHADGTHRPNGIFIARGPRIRRGAQVGALSLLDIAPLLLHLLGIPIPDDLEGRVPTEVLSEDLPERTSIKRGKTTATTARRGSDRQPTPEQREALLKQLRLLGYMD